MEMSFFGSYKSILDPPIIERIGAIPVPVARKIIFFSNLSLTKNVPLGP